MPTGSELKANMLLLALLYLLSSKPKR
jgi:hypothetical protein